MTADQPDDRMQAGRDATGRRLRVQMGIFTAVFVVITALAVVRLVQDGIAPRWPLAGFAVGLIIGVILGRSKALGWNAAAHQVVSSLTIGGVVVTVAYLVFLSVAGPHRGHRRA